MRLRSLSAPVVILLACVAVTGCASDATAADEGAEPAPVATSESPAPSAGEAADLAQAQAWLDATSLPSSAVPLEGTPPHFDSFTSWPCGPYEELRGYWLVPNTTVAAAGTWLLDNPPADLITTHFWPLAEDGPGSDSAIIGFIPAEGAQEGVVYTLKKMDADVAVRAEVAAQTDTATCPPLPDGGMYGAPGQG
ncbi:hypothetical protein [Microbacterium binotii]|uniref:hypothetical protein n=1 Tax=Microbacterium binotii TaxID=462710 RepID=UPI001F1C1A10|nr:hypothetical protein [Microbacterium binotii]UIN30438.1 hypothetical protein LXM64_15035 [Microbacterium binotii]